VAAEETGGRLALVEFEGVRGATAPRHRHHWEDETLFVVTGQLRVFLGRDWHEVGAGAAIVLPRGIEHTFVVATERARLLIALTPAGFENFYRELAIGMSLERQVVTAARYGCEITGPAPLG
jgi:quercetin dioxygenase-like cupin family protein